MKGVFFVRTLPSRAFSSSSPLIARRRFRCRQGCYVMDPIQLMSQESLLLRLHSFEMIGSTSSKNRKTSSMHSGGCHHFWPEIRQNMSKPEYCPPRSQCLAPLEPVAVACLFPKIGLFPRASSLPSPITDWQRVSETGGFPTGSQLPHCACGRCLARNLCAPFLSRSM